MFGTLGKNAGGWAADRFGGLRAEVTPYHREVTVAAGLPTRRQPAPITSKRP
jgi:hypothetical protein